MKIYNYISALVLLASVAACSSDDDILSPYDADSNAVRIQPSVSGIAVSRTAPQDANSTIFKSGDKIQAGRNVSNDVVKFFPYTFNGSQWAPTWMTVDYPYLRWENGETELDLQAFYPSEEYVSMTSFTLPLDQSDADKIAKADFMTFSGKVTKGDNNSVSFAMQRHTARICVKISSFGDQYKGLNPKCDVEIYSPYKIINVTYSNEIVAKGDGEEHCNLVKPYNYKDLQQGDTAVALVTPSIDVWPGEKLLKITVKVGNSTPEEILYVTGQPGFSGGYSYTYNLKVGKNEVKVNSVTVKPWSEPIIVEGGIATESNPPE